MSNKYYVKVDSWDSLKEMVDHIKSNDIISFDTETTSLNTRQGKIIGISVSGEVGVGYYLPTILFKDGELVDHYIEDKSCHDLAKKIISLLLNKKIIGHNLSFDSRFVNNFYGIDVTPSIYADTILLVHTVSEEGAGEGPSSSFALKEIAKYIQQHIGLDVEREANIEQIELKESIKSNGGSVTKENFEIFKADIDILSKYACADTDLTLRVYNHYIKILREEGLEDFFFEEEVMPLYKEVTIPMESNGMKIDLDLILKSRDEITEDMLKYKKMVLKDLMSYDKVKEWVIKMAREEFPISHRGNFAQEYVKTLDYKFPVSEKTGKFQINAKTLAAMEDGSVKDFLKTGDTKFIEQHEADFISLKLWKNFQEGDYINIQSKKHLASIAFEVLKMKPLTYTDKGQPQFDDDFIQSISDKYEWAKNIRIYNKLLKIKSTYMDRFLDNQEDGMYYFYYKQHATVSGRYGSDAQQLPRPKEEGEEEPIVLKYNNLIRAFFVSKPGMVFIDCDYESLEPKVFSHVADDDGLRDIFRNGWDFYSTIAIRTEKLDQYSPDKKADNYLKKLANPVRQKAKAYSLGIPYGMSPYALAKSLDIPQKEAEKLVNGYLDGFPNLKKWMEESKEFAKRNGYVKTEVGRIRHLPLLKFLYDKFGDDLMDYEFRQRLSSKLGEETVLNMYRDYKQSINNSRNVQIQGLAASIVNRAAIQINRAFKKYGIEGMVVAQIHDQLVMEVREDQAEQASKIVKDKMENTTKISLPLVAPPALAHNLRDGH